MCLEFTDGIISNFDTSVPKENYAAILQVLQEKTQKAVF